MPFVSNIRKYHAVEMRAVMMATAVNEFAVCVYARSCVFRPLVMRLCASGKIAHVHRRMMPLGARVSDASLARWVPRL